MGFRRVASALIAGLAVASAAIAPAAPADGSTGHVFFDSITYPGANVESTGFYFWSFVWVTGGLAPLSTASTSGFEAAADGEISGVSILAATYCTTDCAVLEVYFMEENATGDGVITPPLDPSSPGYVRVPESAMPRPPAPDPDYTYLAPTTLTFPTPLPVQAGHRYFLVVRNVDHDSGTHTALGITTGPTPDNAYAASATLSPPTVWSFPHCDLRCLAMQVYSGPAPVLPQPVSVVVSGAQSYGAASPTLAISANTPSGDVLTGTVSCTQVSDPIRRRVLDATTPAGRWLVHGPSCGGLTLSGPTASNYQISYYSGHFTVSKVPLTVTAIDVTRPYGLANPPLTYTLAGFVNGEDASVVSGQPALATSVTSTTAPGVYPITVNTSGMQAVNYSIVPVAGSFTVVRATPVITAPTLRVRTALAVNRVQYTATLHNTTSSGPPIAGVQVTFSVRVGLSRVGCTAVTNTSGVASCTSSNVLALMLATPRSYTISVPNNLQNYTGATATRPIVY